MPKGPGTYGSKVGRPPKRKNFRRGGAFGLGSTIAKPDKPDNKRLKGKRRKNTSK
jgi:hypothetical protein